ncbi:unnamed protein product, partial [Ectocarpus sp. 4 AP-2014]
HLNVLLSLAYCSGDSLFRVETARGLRSSTATGMNLFRLLGDMSHLTAIVLLPYKLHTSRSAAGLSLKMQELSLMVFLTRYLDLFYVSFSWYNSVTKIAYIILTALTIGMLKYRPSLKASYDASVDRFRLWVHGIIPSFVLAVIVQIWQNLLGKHYLPGVIGLAWNFSQVLEPLAVVPQLLVSRGSTDTGRLGWTYVTLICAHRALYILNWVYRSYNEHGYRYIPLVYAAGTVQTGIYLMFLVDRRVRCSPHLPPDETGDVDIMEPTSSARERLLPDQDTNTEPGRNRERGLDGEVHVRKLSGAADATSVTSRRGRHQQGEETVSKIESVLSRERGQGQPSLLAMKATEDTGSVETRMTASAAAAAAAAAAADGDGEMTGSQGVYLV